MKPYNPGLIEKKWQEYWEKEKLFQSVTKSVTKSKNKFYALFAFAYPSGSGLHVGHVESKTAMDILVRFLRMSGKDVFFPVGWDAFGLPAENYAIKTGVHPAITTDNAIQTFEKQVKRLGISYDWETEIRTCDPEYYKWTQWIFIQLFKNGLAYRDTSYVNWCPNDKTVLANEQVVNGECERCGTKVIQKELEQWKFRITKYQDELLSGLDTVDWPEPTKLQQRNWIGKSKGLSINFKVFNSETTLPVWTKYWETIYGVTFLVISPEKFKELGLLDLVNKEHQNSVLNYLDASMHKTEEERQKGSKVKTGVDTGIFVINPVNGMQVKLYIADYVLLNVGTGIVMGVPSHDQRDFDFAQKFNLPIIQVIASDDPELNAKISAGEIVFEGPGVLTNSDKFTGLSTQQSKKEIAKWLISEKFGEWKTTYKLRDWLISRQRYWGAPIPMVYCSTCARVGKSWFNSQTNTSLVAHEKWASGWYPIEDAHLPVLLPDISDFKPTDDGKSPLERADEDWKYINCPVCGSKAKREVDTMDTFVDSSWYFLRYVDSKNSSEFASRDLLSNWLPVDMYMIGPEHTVLHLLYSRFFTKFLRDLGFLTFDEPFMKMRHQGMILGPDGKKMSKSKGNVINPDEVCDKFGADTLRLYEMFMGPLDADKAWDASALSGIYRFLSRIYMLTQRNLEILTVENADPNKATDIELKRKLNKTIKKVTDSIPDFRFNTSIASMMEFVNQWSKSIDDENKGTLSKEDLNLFLKVLAPFAPYLSEEIFQEYFSYSKSIHLENWSSYDPNLAKDDSVEVIVQINGKLKIIVVCNQEDSEKESYVIECALKDPAVALTLKDKTIKKTIFIKAKVLNFVI